MKDIHRVLKTIQVNSEKAQILTEDNIYVFKVDKRATKIEIKEAVKRVLGKEVLSVKTANYTGKKKKRKNKSSDGAKTKLEKGLRQIEARRND